MHEHILCIIGDTTTTRRIDARRKFLELAGWDQEDVYGRATMLMCMLQDTDDEQASFTGMRVAKIINGELVELDDIDDVCERSLVEIFDEKPRQRPIELNWRAPT